MLTRTRIITMLVIAVVAFVAWFIFVYNMTGWDARRFTGESLTIVGYSIPIMLFIVGSTLIYGTKPIWDSYQRKEEKQSVSEIMIQKYEKHTLELTLKLDAYRNHLNSDNDFPFTYGWWKTLELFESRKEYLQHLITGHRNLFEMMIEVDRLEGKDDAQEKKHKQYNDEMGQFVKAVMAGGETLKGCCSSCKGMFSQDEVAGFERQFTELEHSELYKKWSREN